MSGRVNRKWALALVLGGLIPAAAQAQNSAAGAGMQQTTGAAIGGEASSGAAAELAPDSPDQLAAKFQDWLGGFRLRAIAAGIAETTLDRALADVAYDPTIIERDRNQSEHTRQIWDYLDRAVSADRIQNGRAALTKHSAVFDRIAQAYAIEPEVVAAIWGLETAYGTFRGSLPVLSSLATLAFDARRSSYFEKELIEALKIVQAGHVDLAEFNGSWAGASGHTQFMPSSFWRSAVDFTGDGRRNLWGEDPSDALASAAAYLVKSGWQKGLPWGVEVTLPKTFPWEQSGERIRKPLSEWRALGVTSMDGGVAAAQVPEDTPASVLLPAGHEGAAFLIFKNFQVIETYNTADAYVIAIGTLSDQLAGRAPITGAWPRGDKALSGAEKKELQALLLARGHDPKGVDGIMGPNTIQAIRDYQRQAGLVPDGYASHRLIERLRSEAAALAGPGETAAPIADPATPASASPDAAALERSAPAPSTGVPPASEAAVVPAAPKARPQVRPSGAPAPAADLAPRAKRPPGQNTGG